MKDTSEKLRWLPKIEVVVFLFFFMLVTSASGATVTVDFDALDTSSGRVTGAALDTYLAGFGITLTDVTGTPGPPDPVIVNADAQSGVPTRSTNVVGSSAPNIFEMSETDHSNSYTFVFDIPLDSFSFTRAGRCTSLAFPDWTAVAKDEFGTVLDTVGEPDGSTGAPCSSPTPTVIFTLTGPGIKSVTISSGSDGFSGRAGPAIDDLVLTFTEVDTTPPEVSCNVDANSLWSPNHKLVDVGFSFEAADEIDPNPVVELWVFSDEDDEETSGDGSSAPDAVYDDQTLQLRSERKGGSDGRVYLIVVVATDAAGNVGFDCCTVVVPKSKSKKHEAAVQAQALAAEAFCSMFGEPPPGFVEVGEDPVIE